MPFLSPIGYEIVLVAHILSVTVAIGAVTVTDYLHIIGLRDKRIEKKLLFVYVQLSRMIHLAIIAIVATGALLLYHKQSLLISPIFQTKMFLFGVALLNGWYLQKVVFPEMDACVRLGKDHCSLDMLFKSSLSGSISVVTWYTIMILVLTKEYDHSIPVVFAIYLLAIAIAFTVALVLEKRARKWEG